MSNLSVFAPRPQDKPWEGPNQCDSENTSVSATMSHLLQSGQANSAKQSRGAAVAQSHRKRHRLKSQLNLDLQHPCQTPPSRPCQTPPSSPGQTPPSRRLLQSYVSNTIHVRYRRMQAKEQASVTFLHCVSAGSAFTFFHSFTFRGSSESVTFLHAFLNDLASDT